MNDTFNIIEQLELYDDAYFNGDSVVSDAEYDALKKLAYKQFPNDPYFMQVGSNVRGGKIKLPFIMGSLNQKYEGEIGPWVIKYSLQNEDCEDSDKYDGVSCMLQFNARSLQIGYSRGNGTYGADITRHIRNIPGIPQTIALDGHVTIRGEIIMKKQTFADKWSDVYANARQMVAGAMNRSTTKQEILNDIDFIAYQIVHGSEEFQTSSQREDLELLKRLGFTIARSTTFKGRELNDDLLTAHLADAKRTSEYELDGSVITINRKSAQKNLSNSSSINPEHSVKYKVIDKDSIATTTVVNVHYQLSQHGFWKPRVEIIPVDLFGTVVTYATGFNGRYIVSEGIGPGAIIKITKGGSTIPDIVEVVTPAANPTVPGGLWSWNKTGTEMVVDDYENHPSVIFEQVLRFFNTLDVELLKEATLNKVIDYYFNESPSYEEIIHLIMGLLESEWIKVVGSNGSKIYASLQRRLSSLTLETYLGAVKYLGFGFGVRKAKALLRGLDDINQVWYLKANQIAEMEGFDTTATTIQAGLPWAKAFFDALNLTTIQHTKTSELAGLNVVFTGFRDKDFQSKIELAGGKVGTSVSKKTTHVISMDDSSSKTKKAKELGIEVFTLDEFKDKFNL